MSIEGENKIKIRRDYHRGYEKIPCRRRSCMEVISI